MTEPTPLTDTSPGSAEATGDAWWEAVPYLVVRGGEIVEISAAVADELDGDPAALAGRLDELGTRLDDVTFEQLCAGEAPLRLRLGPDLLDRPVRLRRLGGIDDVGGVPTLRIELRSLLNEFRVESLLRRSGIAHMLLTPSVELQWSMTSHELNAVLPGDNPTNWIELMNADDMQTLGKAIYAVGQDPTLRRTVTHRLDADETHTIVDEIESAVHDPDLRGVLVRSRLHDPSGDAGGSVEPYAGITVSDHMPIGVVVASLAGVVLHRNAVATELIRARLGQSIVPGGDGPSVLSDLSEVAATEFQAAFASACGGVPAACTVPSPYEADRWLRISISPAAASTVVLTVEDTTDLAVAERAVRTSNRLLEALDAHSEDTVVVFDADGVSRYRSSSDRRPFRDPLAIETIDDVVRLADPADRRLVEDLLQRVRSMPLAAETVEFRLDRDGISGRRWHQATMTNLLDDADVGGLVVTLRDVHERHLVERELRFKATHDALTTLPDRAALVTRLEELIARRATNERTALMFCDVDNFKLINDRVGHRIGDLVLTTVADRLRASLRSSDFVGRFGGDEFVVVAPDVRDDEHALELARRVFSTVTGTARCDDIDVDISVSLGVAVSDESSTTAAGLLHRADLAMYDAKRAGRGRVALYSPDARREGEGDLRAELRSAMVDGEFTLHYQPITALRPGLPSGHEALARWNHPARGTISAGDFIEVAEAAGLASRLGQILIDLACDDQRTWHTDGFVSINMSAAQLGHADAASAFLRRMDERGADLRQIVIELTEAAFAHGPIATANLSVFRDAGVRVFLDDFGVGYSSLSHLHQFPVDGIKIDRSAIDPDVDEHLVELIVGVARTLGIVTVAEGIETEAQLEAVRRLGVDYGQGYLLGRPSPAPTETSRS